MNKVQTLLFSLILLLSPIAGCLEDNAEEDDTTPEDEPSPINQDVNETDDNTGGGTDNTGNGDDDGEDTSPNTPVNETDDNTGGTDSNGNTGNSGDNTDNSNQNETNDNSEEEEEEETNPGENSGGEDNDSGNGDNITVGNTTECDTGETGFAFSIVQFDISNHPDFVNIGGLEIECSSNILYGFAWDNVAEVEHFISIDPSNGLVTSLAEIPGIELVTSHSTFANDEYFCNNERRWNHISCSSFNL